MLRYDRAMQSKDIQDRMLRAMRPADHGERPERWQQQKSAIMRQRLVDAAIVRLVENGYTGLTTAAVAERCAVSRGAMHHHFPTRIDLVAAVIDHVFYQRMRSFLEGYFAGLAERGEELLVEIACQQHWKSAQSREYAAYLELAVAARTDAELAQFFNPAARRYDEVWTSEMIEAFPQWRDQWDLMKLASDFTMALHMGMLLHEPVFGAGDRTERLQAMLVSVLQQHYADR